METTIQTGKIRQSSERTSSRSQTSVSSYAQFIERISFNYFGIISMTILIGSILGGIGAMYILKNNAPIWELGLCMAGAMANNVAAIGQAPTKWVVNLFIVSSVISVLLILVNLS